MNPLYGMWVHHEETQLYWINSSSFEATIQYELVGVLIGLAVFNGVILKDVLPSVLFKSLCGLKPTIDDLAQIKPQVAAGLKQLLAFDGDIEEEMCLDFTTQRESWGSKLTV